MHEVSARLQGGAVESARGERVVHHQGAPGAAEARLRAAIRADQEIRPQDEHQLPAGQSGGALPGGEIAHFDRQRANHQLAVAEDLVDAEGEPAPL